jgi:hypothetical protein
MDLVASTTRCLLARLYQYRPDNKACQSQKLEFPCTQFTESQGTHSRDKEWAGVATLGVLFAHGLHAYLPIRSEVALYGQRISNAVRNVRCATKLMDARLQEGAVKILYLQIFTDAYVAELALPSTNPGQRHKFDHRKSVTVNSAACPQYCGLSVAGIFHFFSPVAVGLTLIIKTSFARPADSI